jgi:hypothetical protein
MYVVQQFRLPPAQKRELLAIRQARIANAGACSTQGKPPESRASPRRVRWLAEWRGHRSSLESLLPSGRLELLSVQIGSAALTLIEERLQ